jgi:hypothetical protein
VGPVAFVIVFMLVPLAAAVFAGGFFAGVGIFRLLAMVPAGAWAGLTVAAGLVVAARLWIVLRSLRRLSPPQRVFWRRAPALRASRRGAVGPQPHGD